MTNQSPRLSNRSLIQTKKDAKHGERRLSVQTHDPSPSLTQTHTLQSSCPHSPLSPIAAAQRKPSSSVDYGLLFDAMNDPSMSSDTPPTTTDSLDSMLSYLQKNDQLAQQMDDIEQLENLTFLRVMYIGLAAHEEKRLFLKKLCDGLSGSLFRHQDPSSTASFAAESFREKKHHLLPLSLFFMDDQPPSHLPPAMDSMTMFEDNGVAIVEADFTTQDYDPETVLHYVYSQCLPHFPAYQLDAILQLPPDQQKRPFDGHVFADASPSGIDLCVYFYHDAVQAYRGQVSMDMDLLWKLSALSIPILPILSVSSQTAMPSAPPSQPSPLSPTSPTSPTPPSPSPPLIPLHDSFPHPRLIPQQPRTLDQRRNELALLFCQWRIKMTDISNLVVDQPSFQFRGSNRPSSQQDTMMEQRLGQCWATSSLVPPTPYHVLSLFQFVNIDRSVISKLLRSILHQQKRHQLDLDGDQTPMQLAVPTAAASMQSMASASIHSTSTTPTTSSRITPIAPSTRQPSPPSIQLAAASTYSLIIDKFNQLLDNSSPFAKATAKQPRSMYARIGVVCLLLMYLLRLLLVTTYQPSYRASLIIMDHHSSQRMVSILVNTYDDHNQPRWVPEPPKVRTNLPMSSHSSYLQAPAPVSSWRKDPQDVTHFMLSALPNKTASTPFVLGHYYYALVLPSCSALDPNLDYVIHIQPTAAIPPRHIQGSPYHLPKDLLCPQDDRFSAVSDDNNPWHIVTMVNTLHVYWNVYVLRMPDLFVYITELQQDDDEEMV
ncbi:hypothetical protein DM01DRAFT_1330667, partial [Hesseltinella vesiculosa]